MVYGQYPYRKNSFIKNLTSKFNAYTSRVLLGRPKTIVSSNYWVITRMVRNEVIKYTSYNPYVDAFFYRVTHNIADVPIEHFKREYGSSNYTFPNCAPVAGLFLTFHNSFGFPPILESCSLSLAFIGPWL